MIKENLDITKSVHEPTKIEPGVLSSTSERGSSDKQTVPPARPKVLESMELVGKDDAIVGELEQKTVKMKQQGQTSPASVQKHPMQNPSSSYSIDPDIQSVPHDNQQTRFKEILPDLSIDIVRQLEKDIQALEKLLETKHIVSIIGPTGGGKTILAKALFNQMSNFFDKVCFLSIKDLESNGVRVMRSYILQSLGCHDVVMHNSEVRADESHPTSIFSSGGSSQEQDACQVTDLSRFFGSDEKLLIIIDDVDKYAYAKRAELMGILAEINGMKIDKKVVLTGQLYDEVSCYVWVNHHDLDRFQMNGMSYEICAQAFVREYTPSKTKKESDEARFVEVAREILQILQRDHLKELFVGKYLEQRPLRKLEEWQEVAERLKEEHQLRKGVNHWSVAGIINLEERHFFPKEVYLWGKEFMCVDLKIDQMFESPTLKSLPENLSALQRKGDLCMESLEKLPEIFGEYSNTLTLECKNLKCLPENFSGLSLEKLKLNCRSLRTLPESLFRLHLKDLEVDSEALEALPWGHGALITSLTKLTLNCKNLRTLPESFGYLSSLRELTLNCRNLRTLPESFGYLSSLRELTLNCRNLRTLPESFGRLVNLSVLKLKMESLKGLPSSIGSIKNICELEVHTDTLEFTIKSDEFWDGDVNSPKYIPSSIFDIMREYLSIKNTLRISGSPNQGMGCVYDVETFKRLLMERNTEVCHANPISIVGRVIPSNCTAEFFFDSRRSMSSLVGVGVDDALVTVCKESPKLVTIQEDFETRKDSVNVEFKVITLELDQFGAQLYQHEDWSREDMARNFGIGIRSDRSYFRQRDVEADAKPSECLVHTLTRFWILKEVLATPLKYILDYEISSNNMMNFPLLSLTWLWNLVSRERNACESRSNNHDSKDHKIVASSSHAIDGRQNSGEGRGGGGRRGGGGGRGCDDGLGGPGGGSNSSEDRLTVEVFLKTGGVFIESNTEVDIERFNTNDSITPTLIFHFTKGMFATSFNVQFSISDEANNAKIFETKAKFGYSHDHFKILFGCCDKDTVRLEHIGAANEGVKMETTFTNTLINTQTPTTVTGGVSGGYSGFGASAQANISATKATGAAITRQSQVAGKCTSGDEVNGFQVTVNPKIGERPILDYDFEYRRKIIPKKHLDVSMEQVQGSNDELEDDCKKWGVHTYQKFGVGPSIWLPCSLASNSYRPLSNYLCVYQFKAKRTFRKWVKGTRTFRNWVRGTERWEEIKKPQEYERSILINHDIESFLSGKGLDEKLSFQEGHDMDLWGKHNYGTQHSSPCVVLPPPP